MSEYIITPPWWVIVLGVLGLILCWVGMWHSLNHNDKDESDEV